MEATDGGKSPRSSQKDIQFEVRVPVVGPSVEPLTFPLSSKTIQLQETAPVFDFLDTVTATGGGSSEYWYNIVGKSNACARYNRTFPQLRECHAVHGGDNFKLDAHICVKIVKLYFLFCRKGWE